MCAAGLGGLTNDRDHVALTWIAQFAAPATAAYCGSDTDDSTSGSSSGGGGGTSSSALGSPSSVCSEKALSISDDETPDCGGLACLDWFPLEPSPPPPQLQDEDDDLCLLRLLAPTAADRRSFVLGAMSSASFTPTVTEMPRQTTPSSFTHLPWLNQGDETIAFDQRSVSIVEKRRPLSMHVYVPDERKPGRLKKLKEPRRQRWRPRSESRAQNGYSVPVERSRVARSCVERAHPHLGQFLRKRRLYALNSHAGSLDRKVKKSATRDYVPFSKSVPT